MNILDDRLWLGFAFSVYQFLLKDPSVGTEIARRSSGKDQALQAWLTAACEDGRLCIDEQKKAGDFLWAMHEGIVLIPAILWQSVDAEQVDYQIKEIIRMFLCRYSPDYQLDPGA